MFKHLEMFPSNYIEVVVIVEDCRDIIHGIRPDTRMVVVILSDSMMIHCSASRGCRNLEKRFTTTPCFTLSKTDSLLIQINYYPEYN